MSIPGLVARHRALVFVSLVVAGIGMVTYFTIRAGTNDKAGGPSQTATTKVDGAAGELVKLVERGRSVNVDVAYKGSTGGATDFTAHLWRRSPLVRLDMDTGAGDSVSRRSQLGTSTGPFECTQKGTAPWSCTPKPDLSIDDVGVVSAELVARLSALEVSARDDRFLDTAVRCFTVARPKTATTVPGAVDAVAAAEVCLTSDGIPVRVEAGPTRLDAVTLNRGRAPDSVFRLPT